jgi:hypothetical protein
MSGNRGVKFLTTSQIDLTSERGASASKPGVHLSESENADSGREEGLDRRKSNYPARYEIGGVGGA